MVWRSSEGSGRVGMEKACDTVKSRRRHRDGDAGGSCGTRIIFDGH